MNYIPFPRIDLDKDTDLDQWRNNNTKRESDWTALKEFLAKQARVDNAIHPIPKCWYSELPQGDNYALDVEHFRPKKRGLPLSEKQIRQIEKLAQTRIYQHIQESNYPWLEFDYRNYRLVTALTNRSGGKYIYFPVANHSKHLQPNEYPWVKTELPLLLDPTNRNDASLLYVLPNGEIAPITPCTPLSVAAQVNPKQHWQSDGFKYIRAMITIFFV